MTFVHISAKSQNEIRLLSKNLHLSIYQSSAISFITELPKELDFHKIIDYNVQFEKSFIEPLKFITDKILWRIDQTYGTQGTLEDFFGYNPEERNLEIYLKNPNNIESQKLIVKQVFVCKKIQS